MEIIFDLAKSSRNEAERQLSFNEAVNFNWDSAVIIEDKRFPYPEQRLIATGFLGDRLHVLCFTRVNSDIRVISFRKTNLREVKKYEQEIKKAKENEDFERKAANEPRW